MYIYAVFEEKKMELYILAGLTFVYVITVMTESKVLVRKIWTIAFITAFAVSAIALMLLRVTKQDVMMTADTFNWYYVLYVFGAMSMALGIINLWIYRGALKNILSSKHNVITKE